MQIHCPPPRIGVLKHSCSFWMESWDPVHATAAPLCCLQFQPFLVLPASPPDSQVITGSGLALVFRSFGSFSLPWGYLKATPFPEGTLPTTTPWFAPAWVSELSCHGNHYFEALSPSWVALGSLLRSICLSSHTVDLRIATLTSPPLIPILLIVQSRAVASGGQTECPATIR